MDIQHYIWLGTPNLVLTGKIEQMTQSHNPIPICTCRYQAATVRLVMIDDDKNRTEAHFNRPQIFLLYFYNAYNVNLWEKFFGRSTAYLCKTNVFVKFYLLIIIIKKKSNRHSWRLNNLSKPFLNQWETMVFRKP